MDVEAVSVSESSASRKSASGKSRRILDFVAGCIMSQSLAGFSMGVNAGIRETAFHLASANQTLTPARGLTGNRFRVYHYHSAGWARRAWAAVLAIPRRPHHFTRTMSCEDQFVQTPKESGERPAPRRLVILSDVRRADERIAASESARRGRLSCSFMYDSAV